MICSIGGNVFEYCNVATYSEANSQLYITLLGNVSITLAFEADIRRFKEGYNKYFTLKYEDWPLTDIEEDSDGLDSL